MTDYNRFDVSDAESDFGTVATIATMAGGRYGIEARPWKRPELQGPGWNGLDLFLLEVGDRPWWAILNRTPSGFDRELDNGAPVGMRADDPRWANALPHRCARCGEELEYVPGVGWAHRNGRRNHQPEPIRKGESR